MIAQQEFWAFAAQLALSAFVVSAVGCSELVEHIVPPHLHGVHRPSSYAALTAWQEGHDEPLPVGLASHRQKACDDAKICASYCELLEASPDPSTCTRLLAVTTKGSGA